MSYMRKSEKELTKVESLDASDLVRCVKGGSSRNITVTNLKNTLVRLGIGNGGSVTTTTTNYTLTSGTTFLLCDTSSNAITATLPDAIEAANYVLTIKNIDGTNDVTVQTTGGALIDGLATDTLAGLSAGGYLSDGTNWYIVNA